MQKQQFCRKEDINSKRDSWFRTCGSTIAYHQQMITMEETLQYQNVVFYRLPT